MTYYKEKTCHVNKTQWDSCHSLCSSRMYMCVTSHAKTLLLLSVRMAELKAEGIRIPQVRGILKTQKFRTMYEAKLEFPQEEGSHTTNFFWTLFFWNSTKNCIHYKQEYQNLLCVWYSSSSYLNGHYQQVWEGIPWNIWIPLYLVIPASTHCFLVQGVGLIINKIFCELFFNMVQL